MSNTIKKNRGYKQRTQSLAALRAKYKIGEPQYLRLWERSGGRCEICQTELLSTIAGDTPAQFDSRLAQLDHCHKTGAVRGILCRHCNWWLGNIGDSVESCFRAAEYLLGELTGGHFDPLSPEQLACSEHHSGVKSPGAKQYHRDLCAAERAAWSAGKFKYLCRV